ncbi:MAG: YdcF family protein [Corynebacterium sp.]|jgi:vancomycin permeability regulator SanA|nr:YdcF family protein [Corynebacterium sp.]
MFRLTTSRPAGPGALRRLSPSAPAGPVFAASAAVPGLLMAATLTAGGVVAWRDPLMRPPKLPNRRPPAWGLPAAGVVYGAVTIAAAKVVGRGVGSRVIRRRSRTAVGQSAATGTAAAGFPSAGFPPAGSPSAGFPPAVIEKAAAAFLSAAAVPGVMLPIFDVARRTWARRDTGPAGTVIVLGCALRDGRPSSLLRYRLELAERVARRAPGPATVICCGGIGEDGGPSEAEVMSGWLRDRGLTDVRLEALSTSTLENLANAAPMVDRGPVTVVTSDFHVFRAGSLARRAGHAGWRVEGSPTPPQYWATSMLREFLALGTWWPAPGIAVGAAVLCAWDVVKRK